MKKREIILLLLPVVLAIFILKIIVFPQRTDIGTQVAGAKTSSATITPAFAVILTLIPTFTPTPTPTVVPTPTLAPVIILPKDLDELFTKYSDEYSVNKELLRRIANCESSLNPNASTSRYAGLFQFAEPIWIQTRNLMGQNPDVNLRFNAEESVRTAAFMISQGHLGIWPNCGK
jgi:hypothetical protein